MVTLKFCYLQPTEIANKSDENENENSLILSVYMATQSPLSS